MPPKAKGKEKATPEKPAPVMSMRLHMKLAEEESKKKEAEANKEDDDSESDPALKVESKSRSRTRPVKSDSKAKKADSSASESEQESPVKSNQRRSTRVAAAPVSTEKDATTNSKTKTVSKRGKASQKATSEADSSSEDVSPSKPASKSAKTASKGAKKKIEEGSESKEEEEEEEPIRSKANRGKPANARKTVASKKEPKRQTQTAKKRGKKANVSDKQTSDSDNLEDSSDSDSESDSGSNDNESGRSSNGETHQKHPKSPQQRIGRPPGAKNKPKADIITSDDIVPEKIAPESVNVSVTAPIVSTAGRIKKKGLFLDSEVVDQPTTTATDTAIAADNTATNPATANKSAVNFTLPADSSLLKLAQLGKGTTSIPRSTSSVSINSSNSITDLAGASDIITTTSIKHSSTTSSSKRIGKKEHVNAELLNSVKINRGEWLRQLEQKISSTEELSAARKSAHHSSSYSSSYTTNNSYSDHSATTGLALWGSLFDDQKTQDTTRVFLEKLRMDVNKSGLKKTDKTVYQSAIEVVDRCDVYAVYDQDMYTHREPSEYTRFLDMSLVLQDEGVNTLNELSVTENSTTNDPSTTIPTTTATNTSPYEIENETVPKPLHIDPNPNDVAQALTWWGMRPDGALLQEIDRKRTVRAEEYQMKVRQAAEKAEQDRLKKLELLAKQKADDERRAKWLERTAKKAASVATTATTTNAATTPSTIPDKTGSSKQTAPVAPPAPVRAAPPAPIRGPRDRDYSDASTTTSSSKPPSSTAAAPPVPAPPAVEPKTIAPPASAPPVPASVSLIVTNVPAPPPVLTAPTSKVHKDRDYSSTANSTATDEPSATTATNTIATTTTITTEPPNKVIDTARIRSKSRDYSDEPSSISFSRTSNPPSSTSVSSTSVANKTPNTTARPAAQDRDYSSLGSKNTTNADHNRDGNQAYKDTRTSNHSSQRSDSRGRSRNVTKDQYGRDVYTIDSYCNREVMREDNKEPRREQSKNQGSKRSRSRSAGRNVRAYDRSVQTSSSKSDTTYSTTTKPAVNSARSDGNITTKSSSINRDVSPVLSRALSTGRDGPKGGPSPPTVKSTIGSVLNTSSTRDSGGAGDVSGSGRKRDGRESRGKDSSTHVHISSKVVVPANASAARITVATTASNSSGASGQKRQRSPSPTSTTSNKKDAFGRSVPATSNSSYPSSSTNRTVDKHSKSQARSDPYTDKPLTPTSSYRERNVPRPPGAHSSHHRNNHNQNPSQRQGQSQDTAHNQPSGRTVHTNDHNYYNAVNSRQQSNVGRDRNRHY